MADAQAPKAVAVAPQVQPHTEVSSEQQKQGRKAICTAVAYAASRFKKKHRKEKAMEMALESYQGERGTQGADQAVAAAMEEYQRGAWDESLCSTTAFGGLTLPKGAIGAAMR